MMTVFNLVFKTIIFAQPMLHHCYIALHISPILDYRKDLLTQLNFVSFVNPEAGFLVLVLG
jgi:hypothetical protein